MSYEIVVGVQSQTERRQREVRRRRGSRDVSGNPAGIPDSKRRKVRDVVPHAGSCFEERRELSRSLAI